MGLCYGAERIAVPPPGMRLSCLRPPPVPRVTDMQVALQQALHLGPDQAAKHVEGAVVAPAHVLHANAVLQPLLGHDLNPAVPELLPDAEQIGGGVILRLAQPWI